MKVTNKPSTKPVKKARRIYKLKSKRSRITTANNLVIKKVSRRNRYRSRSWKNLDMKQAIEMVKSNKLNLTSAASRYNVPTSTLSRYLKDNIVIDEDDDGSNQDQDLESVEELSEIVSENGIESASVSSSSSRLSKNSEPGKAVYMARKSTSPLKVLLKPSSAKLDEKPTDDILQKFEEQKQIKRVYKDDFPKDNVIDTITFIDSVLSNSHKQKYNYLNEFEKPIKLYSYIGLRQRYHPVYLNRNLNYLKNQNNKNKSKRNIKVDDILEMKKKKLQKPVVNELQLKLDSIHINNKDDRNHIFENMKKKSENIKIEICLSKQDSSIVLATIPHKNIQIVDQSSLIVLTLIQSQFISIEIDPNYNHLSVNVKINEKILNFKYKLNDLKNFFEHSQRSTPSKSNLFDFTFKLESQNSSKSHRSVQSLIDTFNSSNLIKFKVKLTRSFPNILESKPQGSTKKSFTEVFYQFFDQNDKKLITKTNGLKCPFCSLNSNIHDHGSLFKHLVNCHFRLQIKQTVSQNGINAIKMDLSIDDTFDGSYCGYLHNLIKNCHLGFTKSRICPTKQISIDSTEILCNKRSFSLNLNQLIKNENLSKEEINTLSQIQQQLAKISSSIDQAAHQKHNFMQRVYYHTVTSQPVHICEINYDSDSEMDPEWMRELTTLLINDFADVNEGEKKLMQLWNLHCLHYNFVADSQIYSACSIFIDEQIQTLVNSKLVNNFILHLVNLNDYNLLNLKNFVKLIEYLSQKLAEIKSNGKFNKK